MLVFFIYLCLFTFNLLSNVLILFFQLALASSIERKIILIDNACFRPSIIIKSYDSIESNITLTNDACSRPLIIIKSYDFIERKITLTYDVCSRPLIIIKSYGLHVMTLEEM